MSTNGADPSITDEEIQGIPAEILTELQASIQSGKYVNVLVVLAKLQEHQHRELVNYTNPAKKHCNFLMEAASSANGWIFVIMAGVFETDLHEETILLEDDEANNIFMYGFHSPVENMVYHVHYMLNYAKVKKETIKKLLSSKNSNGKNLLMLAIENGTPIRFSSAYYVYQEHIEEDNEFRATILNAKTDDGCSLLELAACKGDMDKFKKILNFYKKSEQEEQLSTLFGRLAGLVRSGNCPEETAQEITQLYINSLTTSLQEKKDTLAQLSNQLPQPPVPPISSYLAPQTGSKRPFNKEDIQAGNKMLLPLPLNTSQRAQRQRSLDRGFSQPFGASLNYLSTLENATVQRSSLPTYQYGSSFSSQLPPFMMHAKQAKPRAISYPRSGVEQGYNLAPFSSRHGNQNDFFSPYKMAAKTVSPVQLSNNNSVENIIQEDAVRSTSDFTTLPFIPEKADNRHQLFHVDDELQRGIVMVSEGHTTNDNVNANSIVMPEREPREKKRRKR